MKIRVACHVHSDWSYDGRFSLEAIAAIFSPRGFRAVLMTEHDQGFDEARRRRHRDACRAASTENLLLIPGIEYSDAANRVHLLSWGDVPFIGGAMESKSVLAAMADGGGAVVLAHPTRKQAWRAFHPSWRPYLSGIEAWNRKTDGWCPSRDAAELLRGTGLPAFVGMDFHDRRQLFPLTTIVEGEAVNEHDIVAAIRAGKFESRAFGRSLPHLRAAGIGPLLRSAEFGRRRAAAIYRALLSRQRPVRRSGDDES